MEPAKNPATGRYADCVRYVDHNDDMIFRGDADKGKILIPESAIIEIFDGKEFDLDNPYDAAEWEAIRYSKKIAQDRFERDPITNQLIVDGNQKRYGTAEFYVERAGVESKVRNDRRRKIHDAKQYVYNDSDDNLYRMVRLLGSPMEGQPFSDVEDYLISTAESRPDKIIELYTGADVHLRLLLVDAIDKHIIFNKDQLYYYGQNIPLGATESSVINYFKNPGNKRIVDMIKADVYPNLYNFDRSQTIDELTKEDFESNELVSGTVNQVKTSGRTRGAK